VLDPQYRSAAGLYVYFAPAMLCWLMIPVVIKSQEIGEKLGELPWLTLGAGLLNILANLLLIPRYGALGAAGAALAANGALAVVAFWRGRQQLHWPLPRRWIGLAAAALLALAALHTLLPAPQGVWAVAGAFAGYMLGYLALCAAGLFAARGFFAAELDFLRTIASRRLHPAAEASA
jgi:O-antigen/teichoic acid export membrane protein